MKYLSKKEKIKEFIENRIVPAVRKKDLDYEKALGFVMQQTMSSRTQVEEILKGFIPLHMKEIRILTIPDDKIDNWLEEMEKEEKDTKEELKKAGLA